eukprot:TRINITY_DN1320_c0_g1_i2.p1 TRINITY_DN1320_c0_g1~~TRINITY_DN1320_c0_g1_i2.p1  ORF type:complete len:201 (+),score=55.75 TRINITY_DN1320_c0_g1_i2:81-683(+)
MPSYKLTYFNVCGRGEVSRLIFALAGVDFEDIRLEHAEFGKKKANGDFLFGQLPVLEVDGKMIAQSATINRYLARKLNLMPETAEQEADGDMLLEHLRDIVTKVAPILFPKPDMEVFDKVYSESCYSMFKQMDCLMTEEFVAGPKITYFDLDIYHNLNMFILPFARTFKKDFPKIYERVVRVGEVKEIKEWVEKRPKTAF